MTKLILRTYSRYAQEAAMLLGELICCARKELKLTEQELADRAGISRGLLRRIENGGLKSEIGMVFEVAAIVGVKLFGADYKALSEQRHQTKAMLTLLPKSIRKSKKDVNDDF